MRKLIIFLMLFLWVVITSSSQREIKIEIEKPTLVKSLDSLNTSLDKLKLVIDERY